jgi:DtxR family Mn-dependent transcriptional regulator
MNSFTEENYLKTIFHLSEKSDAPVATNSISEVMGNKAASVTDMLRKLAEKGLINYVKYQGVSLTKKGRETAIAIIRKHRLWEVFLVEKLGFKWDEVHDIAEELEHIKAPELVDRLDTFLGHPTHDPHGDPIPNSHGEFQQNEWIILAKMNPGQTGILSGVSEHSTVFLQYLEQQGLLLGTRIKLEEIMAFDGSLKLLINQNQSLSISREAAKNLLMLHEN